MVALSAWEAVTALSALEAESIKPSNDPLNEPLQYSLKAEPVIVTLPVNSCVSSKVSPNLVEPEL